MLILLPKPPTGLNVGSKACVVAAILGTRGDAPAAAQIPLGAGVGTGHHPTAPGAGRQTPGSARVGKGEQTEKPHPRLQGFPTAKRGRRGGEEKEEATISLGEGARGSPCVRLLPHTPVFTVLITCLWGVPRAGSPRSGAVRGDRAAP